MRVGVYESGDQNVPRTVDLLVGGTVVLGTDGDDPLPVHHEIPFQNFPLRILRDDPRIPEDRYHNVTKARIS